MRIEIIEAADKLRRQRWVYDVTTAAYGTMGISVVLSQWIEEARATPRHKWTRVGEAYARRSHNGVQHYHGHRRPAAEVPVPPDLRARLLAEIDAALTIENAIDPKK